MSLSKHKTPPGGVKRPCSQSRSVATGVAIRVANSACDKPVLARACRSNICSGVVTRPMPAFASLRAARSSAKGKPASASMALATFSIFILNTFINVRWQNRSAARLGVHHHQNDHALLGHIKVNHTYATGLAATGDRSAHFARAASALDGITRGRMFGDPVNNCVPLSLRPQLFRLLLKVGGAMTVCKGLVYGIAVHAQNLR